jgi:O-antigen/teichoic acid export membrane protein/TPR repeat protein
MTQQQRLPEGAGGGRQRTVRGATPLRPSLLRLTSAALSACLTIFLIRRLGPREYGLFAVAIGIATLVSVLADAGTPPGRFAAPGGSDSELQARIARTLRIRVLITGLMCALLAALASTIAGAYAQEGLVWPLRAAAAATFAETVYLTALGICAALGRTIAAVRLETAERLVEVSASVALVLAGAGAAGAVFGRAIGFGLGAVISALVVLIAARSGGLTVRPGPRGMPAGVAYGHVASLFATDRSPALTRSVTVLLLAAYSGPFASGIFMAPAALAGVGHYVGSVTANRVTPRLAKGVPQPMSATLRALIAFQGLILAPVVVWARPITELLLGARYAHSAEVLKALAPFVFFAGLAPLVTRGFDGAEVSRRLLIYAGTLALAVAGGIVLIPRRGVVGGAIAADVAIGFYTLAHLWACRRRYNLRTRAVVWAVASTVTAAGAMGIVLTFVGTKDLTVVDWVRGCVGGLLAYVAMLIFTREVTTSQIVHAASAASARLAGPESAALLDRLGTPGWVSDRETPDAEGSERAEVEYRRADAAGDAGGAFNLGVLLHQQREFAAAAAAYGRAEQRGDRDAAFNLGVLLYEQGDLDGAERAWRRCLRHHHVQAASNLGFLLQRRGDLEGADVAKAAAERWAATETLPSTVQMPASISPHDELTYRLADAAGQAEGAFNLGVLLHQRRDTAAAAAAYERAEQRGDRDAAFNLGVLLYEVGDLDGAEAAWRRCLAHHHVQAASNLGFLLERRGDLEGARAAYAAAERWANATV